MDGLAEDADIVFLLTSNRADLLEPALAARPGRVDLAVEIGLPDEGCLHRLLGLYGQGLGLVLDDAQAVVERTAGTSPAFIKELLRQAALLAVESRGDGVISVRDEHVHAAADTVLGEGAELTRRLLGAAAGRSPAAAEASVGWLPGVGSTGGGARLVFPIAPEADSAN